LPTKQVAYLVLRDPQGNLLVNTSQTSGGGTRIRTQRGQPVELVLAGLGQGGTAPSAQVGLQTTLDGGGNVSVDSLGLAFRNIGPGGLDLGANYPFALTDAFYEPKAATPFGVKATVDLPQVLQTGTTLSTTLSVGAGGFEGRVRTGEYARKHQKRLEGQPPIARVQHPSAADPTVTVKVRGIDFQFGKTPQDHTYKLSGDFQTPLLATRGAGGAKKPVLLHYSGEYAAQSWNLTGTASHIQGDLPMGVGTFDPDQLNGIVVAASDTEFSLKLNGVFAAEDLLQNFAVTVKDLKVGLKKPQGQPTQLLASAGAVGSTKAQQVSLFGGAVDLTVNDFSVGLKKNPFVLTATAGGQLSFLRPNRTVQFSGLTVGSDGSFTAGTVQMQSDLEVLGSYFKVTQLAFQQSNSQVQVDATAEATLPEPVPSTAQADITVGRAPDGTVSADVRGPDFRLDSKTTEFPFGPFATFDLTGVGVDLNIGEQNSTPALYATASLYFNKDTKKRLDFGEAGNIRKHPGIAVELRGNQPIVRFNARAKASPDDPLLTFDMDFLTISLEQFGISGGTNSPLEVTIGGRGEINIKAVFGSAAYTGLTIAKRGIVNTGRFRGGTFGILPSNPGAENPDPLVKIELGFFQRGTNQRLPSAIDTYAGDIRSMPEQSKKGTYQPKVAKYFWFANQEGSALKATINGGKGLTTGGGVDEVLFYKTQNGEIELQIVGVHFQMEGAANVDVTLKYTNVGSGFGLQVLGSASVGGKLDGNGSSGAGGVLIGVIENTPSRKLRVGMFLAVQGFVPILPGLVEIQSAGVGFFLRARDKTVEEAENAVQLSDASIVQNRRDAIRTRNKAFFTVKVFGSAGVLGSGGSYVFKGSAMVTVTSDYAMVDQFAGPGSALPIPGTFESSNVLGINWETESVSGAFYMGQEFSPIITVMDASIGGAFFAGSQGWALYTAGTGFSDASGSGVDVDVLEGIVTASGDLVLCSKGFYIDAKTEASIPKKGIVRVTTGWEIALWGLKKKLSIGAYVETWAKIEAGPATLGTTIKGAYLKDGGDHLLYAYGAVHVIAGPVAGHVAIRDDGVRVGLGKSKKYERMIADAKRQAESLGQQTEETADKAREMAERARRLREATDFPDPENMALSAGQKAEAGYNLYSQGVILPLFASAMDATEHGSAGLPADKFPFNTITRVISRYRIPDSSAVDQARQDMQQELNRLATVAPKVEKRLREAESELEKLKAKHQRQSTSLSSPVTVNRLTGTSGQNGKKNLPSFSVNSAQAQQNARQMGDVKQRREALDRKYRKAIAGALTDLQKFDRIAGGGPATDYQQLADLLLLDLDLPTVTPTPTQPIIPGSDGQGPHLPSLVLPQSGPNGRSISDVGTQYRKTFEAVGEHYAKRLDFYHTWRANVRSIWKGLTMGRQGVKAKVERYRPSFNKDMSEEKVEKIVDVIASRYGIVDEKRTCSQQGSNCKESRASKWKNKDYDGPPLLQREVDDLRINWMQSAMTLWFDMHSLGAKKLSRSLQEATKRVASSYDQKMQSLNEAHRQFTQTVDRFYALKADLATTTYGLTKEYVRWREGATSDTSVTFPRRLLKTLLASLEPPKVTGITAQSQQHGYYTRTKVQWQAVPRSNAGTVREVSYGIEGQREDSGGPATAPSAQSTSGIGQFRFKTIGGGSTRSITHYGFQTTFDFSQDNPLKGTKTFDVGVRARGNGGNTAARIGQFQVSVHPRSTTQPSGSVMQTDRTPPTKPDIRVNVTGWGDTGRQGKTGTVRVEYDYRTQRRQKYWATDSSTVRLVIKSKDPQSDVTKVEYATGTRPGQTDKQGWTQAPGVRIADENNRSGANWNQRITIRDLDLSETQPTYLSLRTTNGAGLTSKVQTVDEPIYYDPTPPKVEAGTPFVPADNYTRRPQSLDYATSYSRKQEKAVQQAPGWASPRTSEPAQGGLDGAKVRVSYSVQNEGSPVAAAEEEIRLLRRSVDPETAFTQSPVCTSCVDRVRRGATSVYAIDWDQTGVRFADTLYAYIRATNLVDQSHTVEVPISPSDRTRPTTPTARVRPTQQGATLYLTQEASDDESGIKGYRYAIGTTPYGTDVRGYPDKGTDFVAVSPLQLQRRLAQGPFLSGSSPAPSPPPSVQIPSDELPSSGLFYVTVRAVNREGKVSQGVTSGPAVYDTTPPPAPTLNAQYDRASQTLTIQAQDMGDPESGLGAPPNSTSMNTAWWQVRGLIDTSRVFREGRFRAANLGTGTFNDQTRLSLASPKAAEIAAFGYRVILTLQNRAGMTRTVEAKQVIEPVAGWSDAAQRRWKRSIGPLRQDGGVSSQEIARLPGRLDAFPSAKRNALLKELEQAASSDQREQVLQTIKDGP
jgi:hypothetical protein